MISNKLPPKKYWPLFAAALLAIFFLGFRLQAADEAQPEPAAITTPTATDKPATTRAPSGTQKSLPEKTAAQSTPPAEYLAMRERFRTARDLLEFIEEAKTLNSGEATHFAMMASNECWMLAQLVKDSKNTLGIERRLHQLLSDPKQLNNTQLHEEWKTFLPSLYRCQNLLSTHPEMATNAMGSDYLVRLKKLGHPMGQVHSSMESVEKGDLDSAKELLRSALASGHPEALYWAGGLIAELSFQEEALETEALAWELVGFLHGIDCTRHESTLTENWIAGMGSCPADGDFAHQLRLRLDDASYDRVIARRDELLTLLAAGRYESLFAAIDPTLVAALREKPANPKEAPASP